MYYGWRARMVRRRRTTENGAMQLFDDTPAEERIGDRDLTAWPSRFGAWIASAALAGARWTSGHAVLVVIAVAGGVLATVLTGVSAEIYDAVEEGDGVTGLDRPALNAAIALRTPLADQVATWFTDLGGPVGMTVLATVVTVAMAVVWRSRTPLVLMVIAVAGSLAMTTVGKVLVGRVRPPQTDAVAPFESSPSFPSGHSLNSVVIAGLIAYLLVRRQLRRRTRILTVCVAALFALAMGLSRVFLGHHWMTDVLVAWTLGLAWLALVVTAHRLFLTVRRARATVVPPGTGTTVVAPAAAPGGRAPGD
jgi:membrane-associated phospholipid phosphatase